MLLCLYRNVKQSQGSGSSSSCLSTVLFCDSDQPDNTIPQMITTEAILAAKDFVDLCCQHAAFIAGRGKIKDEIEQYSTGNLLPLHL